MGEQTVLTLLARVQMRMTESSSDLIHCNTIQRVYVHSENVVSETKNKKITNKENTSYTYDI